MFSMSRLDDEIVKFRALLGVIFGFLAYIVYRAGLVLLIDVSATIWFIAGVVYVASGFYVQAKYRLTGIFHVFIRGIVTYYALWIIVFLVLYDLFG
jgi:hypothetical protein